MPQDFWRHLLFRAWWCGEWVARPAFHRGPLGGLVNLGGWQFAAQCGSLIAGQADRYLLGAFLAPQFVGYYTIAQRLEEAMYIGVLKIGEILFPFFSSVQKESDDRIADLLFRASWVLNLLAAIVLGALIPVAGPLLYAWTGEEVAVEDPGAARRAGRRGNAWVRLERIRLLSSGEWQVAVQRHDRTGNGGRYAHDERHSAALFWLAGGGLERLSCNGRADYCHDGLGATKLQVGGRLASGGSLCIAAAGNRHRDGDRIALSRWAATIRPSPALVVRRGRIWRGGRYHFCCCCGRFADWSVRSGVLAGFARSCRSLCACEIVVTCAELRASSKFEASWLSRSDLSRLTNLLAHRGPDGAGHWFSAERNVALGHRRLAIIDPGPGGNQPMLSADGRSRDRLQWRDLQFP